MIFSWLKSFWDKSVKYSKDTMHFLTIEILAMMISVKDKRVPVHAKVLCFVPIAYIISPIDLIPDAILFMGSLDDYAVVRLSHFLFKKVVPTHVLEENREKARVLFIHQKEKKIRFVFLFIFIWILIATFVFVFFMKKYLKKHM